MLEQICRDFSCDLLGQGWRDGDKILVENLYTMYAALRNLGESVNQIHGEVRRDALYSYLVLPCLAKPSLFEIYLLLSGLLLCTYSCFNRMAVHCCIRPVSIVRKLEASISLIFC